MQRFDCRRVDRRAVGTAGPRHMNMARFRGFVLPQLHHSDTTRSAAAAFPNVAGSLALLVSLAFDHLVGNQPRTLRRAHWTYRLSERITSMTYL
jgi:hypothetical protein